MSLVATPNLLLQLCIVHLLTPSVAMFHVHILSINVPSTMYNQPFFFTVFSHLRLSPFKYFLIFFTCFLLVTIIIFV
jgi:hypothetical protein